jgi:hypothetical protein
MAMVPRPVSADNAIVANAGPNASSVTILRSKSSALAATPATAASSALGRGHASAAAINSDGNIKPTWPAAKTNGCTT